MERSTIVFTEVAALYSAATTSMGKWMWQNHTQWVADRAKELAVKYKANTEQVYCAALIHDLGDSKYERGDKAFESWSWETGKAILKRAGFRKIERDAILEAVRTHSCHPGHMPTAQEGRVLATADAMWHLQTNFFPVICYMNRPDTTHSYEEWQLWFKNKIERDFGTKILFEAERTEVQEDYKALMRVFGNTALKSK
ncbi:MAG TPA: HD domain-containing protein [Candidatus Saccharimonadales bacterium]|nr:HD domain-containing protein [Candidatus Saccharimonadales bacterium]